MKKHLLFVVLAVMTYVAIGCQSFVVNTIPAQMPTPTLAVETKPIGDEEREEAYEFFYELKNLMAFGEYEHFAEEIRYPIAINMDGQLKSFVYVAELEANFEKIFSEAEIQTFIAMDESELIFTSEGVKLPDDKIWFDLICMDSNCEEAEFLITKINN